MDLDRGKPCDDVKHHIFPSLRANCASVVNAWHHGIVSRPSVELNRMSGDHGSMCIVSEEPEPERLCSFAEKFGHNGSCKAPLNELDEIGDIWCMICQENLAEPCSKRDACY
ncbi:hypothetical protein PHLCEN_2v5185 [Hermanssonia centrifuga]|uniref:Uncharacterized protein n=1 Tax=Hermanssonia centrifuga TaxID=98765 RepID=A0A2R6P8S7_9APHY|nr:hypothetical protein PHLCEN_2v5185 [Hermanssonia centrifuga]